MNDRPHCPTCTCAATSTTERLAAWCAERGHVVTFDGCVYADAAAAILEREESTLKNWRHNGGGPPSHRIGRGPIRYALADLAAYVDAARHS